MLGVHKSISLPQSTEYAKEMAKWEAFPSQWGSAGRLYQFRQFPLAMYRFVQEPGKGIVKDAMHIVRSDDEVRNMESRGFHVTQELAVAAIEREHRVAGELAAEREFEIQHGRISERATKEVRAAEEEHGARHLPVIAETPIKRRRGPNKPKATAAA